LSDYIIEIKNVTKTFRLAKRRGFSSFLNVHDNSKDNRIKALDNISFSVRKGEFIGIIGLNGSGKTTLLQTIAGIYQPDEGEIHVKGTLAPILRIGAGFQQELIPKENIVMYGMLLGLSKPEIITKVDGILKFAELEKFSSMKLKHFSSGMKSRLGISTIFELNPEILLLDEILAVGDINFQDKCIKSFSSFKDKGKTILHVTHSLNTLKQFCDRALLLHMGKILEIGDPEDVIQKYREISTQHQQGQSS